jgi:hypothetical protein
VGIKSLAHQHIGKGYARREHAQADLPGAWLRHRLVDKREHVRTATAGYENALLSRLVADVRCLPWARGKGAGGQDSTP